MKRAGLFSVMRMFARMVGRLPAGHLWFLLRRMREEKPHRFGGQTRINTFFPPYPSEAFDRFCEAVIRRRRVPYSTYLAVTGRCPYRCAHCSYAGRPLEEMSTEEAIELIGQIDRIGTCTLGLTGGEPMLRDDLPDLVAAAGDRMATIVFTTGRGLDAARAKRLARAKLDCVTVGIESSDPAAHDAVRGESGSFGEARAAVAVCRDAGLYPAVSTIGTREKLASGELERMVDLAAEWGAGEFRVLAPVATGAWAGCAAEMLTPAERQALADFHIRGNRRRGAGPAVACFARLESPELFGCGAGYHHLFIDAAGNVCPCDLTPLSFGNVGDEPLAEIWRRMGETFARPRCRCLMAQIAEKLPPDADLPLPREQSEAVCPHRADDEPLPEAYRRILEKGD
jgi:MoaA/NifB/PqqE/SkfB family radical SAM enzyme